MPRRPCTPLLDEPTAFELYAHFLNGSRRRQVAGATTTPRQHIRPTASAQARSAALVSQQIFHRHEPSPINFLRCVFVTGLESALWHVPPPAFRPAWHIVC